MSLIAPACIEFNEKRKICTAKEAGKSYTLENESGFIVRKVKADKCLPQKEREHRCDYLMSIDNQNNDRVFFIELKGTKLLDAVGQIFDTIIYLKKEFINYRLEARIVGRSDTPNIKLDPKYRKLAREILPTNGRIIIATNKFYSERI